ncbi:hypothetical protein CHU92_09625 [Flavobacterium cyanobacteriorum]|uniref:PorZ N-terminal beta-propeller domain-containing protein n=1 Tax=Flavobacterium cyanobacteriorum TaxID=2022802 RepID=A0A255Z539_9FLAO|nr:two-component regulator propeller domain-containing protein [Flavobacterium cyanobacteriorum]OYQ36643.1 hypothetical protein CHU92_09625 [Flavobacterium cyanobacteriorum]
MKRILFLLLLLAPFAGISQNNRLWKSYYSYTNIVDLSQSANKVFAAGENAVFFKNLSTAEIKTITSVDGLKTETVTAIHHSTAFNKTLVGNDNGLLLVINSDNSVASRIDIVQEATVQSNRKRINHIYEHEGKAYISCDFGIAVFNIATLEFGDTFYLGPNGAEVPVRQATVHNGYIYAACGDNAGIRRGLVASPNLNDYNQWEMYNFGSWFFITTHNNTLIGGDSNTIFKFSGPNIFSVVHSFSFATPLLDLRSVNGSLMATVINNVRVYNEQLQLQASINIIPGETSPTNFSCATILNDQLFIGTQNKGVFATFINNLSIISNITPNGPLRSNIFSLEKSANALWAVFGGYSSFYEPNEAEYGISKLTAEGWTSIPYEDIEEKNEGNQVASLSDIVVNPNNENEVYIGSFHNGLVKITGDQVEEVFTPLNTNSNGNEGLQSLFTSQFPNYRSVRVNGMTYDRQGNLWMLNTRIPKPLKVLRTNGSWVSYSFEGIIANTFEGEYGKMVIDKNGTKWIPSLNDGLIAFNEGQNDKFIVMKNDSNLPSTYVRCVAIDNRNQLWIGTQKGLRVLRGVDRFLTENELTTNAIIILEDGLAQELMFEQFITDIKVDGANNKWIGTATAGAFLVSPDGQQTLFHFTKLNSPLPSNNINDIEIDPVTGEVFFATDRGMVSYQGTSTKAEENLNNVYVFPNPVRPGFEGDVNISGLIDKANIKITDIEGNLVFETTSEGGTVLWNTTAFGRYKVASGVYMIFIASEDGSETKVKKVMIVR